MGSMGNRFECDVGGGRVVRMTRNGLVQQVKGEPGKWRAVKREELWHGSHSRVAPPPQPPPAAPAAPAAPANEKKRSGSGMFSGASGPVFGHDASDDDAFEVTAASVAYTQRRAAAAARAAAACPHAPQLWPASGLHSLAQVRWPSSSERSPLSPVKPQEPPLRAPAALVAFARQENVKENLAMSAAGACAAALKDEYPSDEEHEDSDFEMDAYVPRQHSSVVSLRRQRPRSARLVSPRRLPATMTTVTVTPR